MVCSHMVGGHLVLNCPAVNQLKQNSSTAAPPAPARSPVSQIFPLPPGPALLLSFSLSQKQRRWSSALSSNGFPGANANLPDLLQQSPSPLASPASTSVGQVGGASGPSHPPRSGPHTADSSHLLLLTSLSPTPPIRKQLCHL